MSAGIKANNDGSAAIQVGGVDRVSLTDTGNVGIGTTSPLGGYRLSLTGGGLNVQNTGVSDNSIVKYSNSGRNWYAGLRGDTSNAWALSDDSSFRLLVDTSGNLQFNSGYGSVATAYGCRAWVNFNGTGTVAIRASGNVSSITDNGAGIYTVNFTNAFPDTNFTMIATSGALSPTSGFSIAMGNNTYTTSSAQLYTTNNVAAVADNAVVAVAFFR
jgi:hypothetical protein